MSAKPVRRGERRYIFRSIWKRCAAGLIDALGRTAVAAATLGRGWRVDPVVLADPRRILVVRLDHLGDVLFIRPCLEALRRQFPQARLSVLVSTPAAELTRLDPNVDEVVAWDAPWFARGPRQAGQTGFFALARQLRARDFDLSLDLRGDIRHHLLLWLARVKVRIGTGLTGGGFLLHREVRVRPGVHEVERNLDLAEAAGARQRPADYRPLELPEDLRAAAERAWRRPSRRVLIHPGSGDPARRAPLAAFQAIARELSRQGGELAVIGNGPEADLARAVAEAADPPARVTAGRLSLEELAACVNSADLLIGNVSGPMHLAVTQGKAVVVLWADINEPEEWGPWGARARARIIRDPQQPEAAGKAVVAAMELW